MTSPALMTGAGMILGTAAYMSPEQARGQAVDKRADVWAFGVLLFEMLSGRRLFDGGTVSDSIAAVLTREPDWSALPPNTPPRIGDLIRRCLKRDPKRRLRDIGDAVIEIEEAMTGAPSVATSATTGATRSVLPWIVAAAMTLVAAGATWIAMRPRADVPRTPARVAITLPQNATMFLGRGSSLAVSPDGQRLVFTATVEKRTQLYVRSLDRMESTALPGTDGAVDPFFSPDGQWVGFSANEKLKKVNLQGRTVVTVTDAPNIRGEAWGPDDRIIFTPSNGSGLWRVPASGGTAEPYTTIAQGELSHRWPQVAPGGHVVIFTIWNDTGFEGGRIVAQRIDGSDRKVLVQGGGYGRIVIDDEQRTYLVYAQADGLLAAPFDLDTLELKGAVTPVVDAVFTNLSGGGHYAFSQTGLLAYLPGSLAEANKDVVWVDRAGKETLISTIADVGMQLRVSSDGRRLLRMNTGGPNRDVWIQDLDRGGSIRLTNGGFNTIPVFTPDEKRMIYSSGLPNFNLFWKPIDGSHDEERLSTSPNAQIAGAVSPDGKVLAYVEFDPVTNADILLMTLEGDRAGRPFLKTRFSEGNPAISPDGHWMAYQSNASGRFEIYISTFPEPGTPMPVTTAGGVRPVWSRDGRELFYQNGTRKMAVPIEFGSTIKVGDAKMLFAGSYLAEGDLARDTGRWVMVKDNGQEAAGQTIYLVMNWFDELRAKLPLK